MNTPPIIFFTQKFHPTVSQEGQSKSRDLLNYIYVYRWGCLCVCISLNSTDHRNVPDLLGPSDKPHAVRLLCTTRGTPQAMGRACPHLAGITKEDNKNVDSYLPLCNVCFGGAA